MLCLASCQMQLKGNTSRKLQYESLLWLANVRYTPKKLTCKTLINQTYPSTELFQPILKTRNPPHTFTKKKLFLNHASFSGFMCSRVKKPPITSLAFLCFLETKMKYLHGSYLNKFDTPTKNVKKKSNLDISFRELTCFPPKLVEKMSFLFSISGICFGLSPSPLPVTVTNEGL